MALDARGAVGLDVDDEVARRPRAGELELLGLTPIRSSRSWSALHEVERAGHDDEPLGVVVDHEVDHLGEAARDGEEADEAGVAMIGVSFGTAEEQRLELRHL